MVPYQVDMRHHLNYLFFEIKEWSASLVSPQMSSEQWQQKHWSKASTSSCIFHLSHVIDMHMIWWNHGPSSVRITLFHQPTIAAPVQHGTPMETLMSLPFSSLSFIFQQLVSVLRSCLLLLQWSNVVESLCGPQCRRLHCFCSDTRCWHFSVQLQIY